MSHENVTGIGRAVFNLKIRLWVFWIFLKETLRRKLSVSRLIKVLRRLEFFLGKLQDNKFVAMGGKTRLGLYIPGAPSKPFETACRKFAVFGEKLPNTTALVSVTSACRFRCEHCYQKNDRGKDVALELLVDAVRKIQDNGAAFFNLEGGEPFLVYDRLVAVCEAIDDRSEIWINSTGDGMTAERLERLAGLGLTAVMFPLHSEEPEEMNAFMGSPEAFETVTRGVELCHEAGIAVAFNMCLDKDAFYDGTFESCMEFAREQGAAIVQMIKPKPAGGWLESGAPQFSEEDLAQVEEKVHMFNRAPEYVDYPAVSAQILEEDVSLFGCTAGGTDRFYFNAKGDVQPCEFLNVSFGNVAEEPFETIYERMRAAFQVPGTCWLCEDYSGKVSSLFKEHGLDSLPLSPELTAELIEQMDRGRPTELYHTIEKKIV